MRISTPGKSLLILLFCVEHSLIMRQKKEDCTSSKIISFIRFIFCFFNITNNLLVQRSVSQLHMYRWIESLRAIFGMRKPSLNGSSVVTARGQVGGMILLSLKITNCSNIHSKLWPYNPLAFHIYISWSLRCACDVVHSVVRWQQNILIVDVFVHREIWRSAPES